MAEVKKKKKSNEAHKRYTVSGETITRKNKSCPKCGAGVSLAEHKDRFSCGRCKYMEKKQ